MNLINNSYTGGFPFTQNDLQWIQSSVLGAIKGLISAYNLEGDPAVILTGCERSSAFGTTTVTEGFIFFEGCVYPVPSHSYSDPTGGDIAFWQVVLTTDPIGDKVFQDSSTHSTYEVREVRVSVAGSLPTGCTNVEDAINIGDRIREIADTKSWTLFASPNSDAFYGTGATPDAVKRRYFKTLDGMVHLKGEYFFEEDDPTVLTIGTLPLGFRPPHQMDFVVLSGLSSPVFFNVRVQTNGDLKIMNAEGYLLFKLHSIPPFSVKS